MKSCRLIFALALLVSLAACTGEVLDFVDESVGTDASGLTQPGCLSDLDCTAPGLSH